MIRHHLRGLVIGAVIGLLCWAVPVVVGQAYYYAKVVRTVDRILRAQNPGIKYTW